MKNPLLLLVLTLILFLAACSGSPADAPKAETISCTAAYRASASQGVEREETITFSDTDSEQSISFTELVFHASYHAGEVDNERNLRLWVSDVAESVVYQTTLYQLPTDSGPQNQFLGGHGFTGLLYSYQTDSNAELQYWCEAE